MTEGPSPSTEAALRMAIGRTIADVTYGDAARTPNTHHAEYAVFHFTDGGTLRIDLGSNAGYLPTDRPAKAEDVGCDLMAIFEGPPTPR